MGKYHKLHNVVTTVYYNLFTTDRFQNDFQDMYSRQFAALWILQLLQIITESILYYVCFCLFSSFFFTITLYLKIEIHMDTHIVFRVSHRI